VRKDVSSGYSVAFLTVNHEAYLRSGVKLATDFLQLTGIAGGNSAQS